LLALAPIAQQRAGIGKTVGASRPPSPRVAWAARRSSPPTRSDTRNPVGDWNPRSARAGARRPRLRLVLSGERQPRLARTCKKLRETGPLAATNGQGEGQRTTVFGGRLPSGKVGPGLSRGRSRARLRMPPRHERHALAWSRRSFGEGGFESRQPRQFLAAWESGLRRQAGIGFLDLTLTWAPTDGPPAARSRGVR
jgi:hypothetical protein